MSCLKKLRTDGLTGADTGGTWTWTGPDGVSMDVDGVNVTLNSGDVIGTTDDPEVDLCSITGLPLPYSGSPFTYSGGAPPCDDTVSVPLELWQVPCAGDDGSIDVCIGDTAVTLYSILGTATCTPCTDGEWTQTAGPTTGVTLSADGDGTNDQFDPAAAGIAAGTLTFEYQCPDPSGGMASCPGICDGNTAVVTINITESFEAGTPGEFKACIP